MHSVTSACISHLTDHSHMRPQEFALTHGDHVHLSKKPRFIDAWDESGGCRPKMFPVVVGEGLGIRK